MIIGADGALSPVARLAGMLDPGSALWGFAIRAYVPAEVPLPLLVLLESSAVADLPRVRLAVPRRGRPGQRGHRGRHGRHPAPAPLRGDLARFTALLRSRGDLRPAARVGPVIGGWLRMGGTGAPAGGRQRAAGRGRGGPDQPAAGRGHRARPWSAPGWRRRRCSPGRAGRARPTPRPWTAAFGRYLPGASGAAARAAAPAEGGVRQHAPGHRPGRPPPGGQHVVDLLERPDRRRPAEARRVGRPWPGSDGHPARGTQAGWPEIVAALSRRSSYAPWTRAAWRRTLSRAMCPG